MNNEGYSRSLNAERSGSTASGTYRAPYKPEPLLTGIIFGVCASVAILVFLFVVRFARENVKNDGTTLILILAATLAVAIFEALTAVTGMLLVKIVRSGYKCSYTADEERFITNEGGKIRTIFFRDVQSVNFFSISIFGKDRGYDVNVRLRNKYDEIFSIVSDNFISEKSTPFWIIAERIEKIRKEEGRESYVKHIPAPGVSDLTVRTQPESISNGKLSDNSQNRDSAMPALNLSAMAAAVSERKPYENTNNSGGYYIDERGRERPYGEIIGSGRFKIMCSRKKTALLAVIAVAAVVTALYFSYVFIEGLVMMSLSASKLLYMPFVVLIAVLAAVSVVIIFRIGDECAYRANGLEFVVTNKRGGETHIDYKHTQGVYYFYSLLGYKVKILTNYGVITYNCLDKRKRVYEKPEKLPFDLISKNIKK